MHLPQGARAHDRQVGSPAARTRARPAGRRRGCATQQQYPDNEGESGQAHPCTLTWRDTHTRTGRGDRAYHLSPGIRPVFLGSRHDTHCRRLGVQFNAAIGGLRGGAPSTGPTAPRPASAGPTAASPATPSPCCSRPCPRGPPGATAGTRPTSRACAPPLSSPTRPTSACPPTTWTWSAPGAKGAAVNASVEAKSHWRNRSGSAATRPTVTPPPPPAARATARLRDGRPPE